MWRTSDELYASHIWERGKCASCGSGDVEIVVGEKKKLLSLFFFVYVDVLVVGYVVFSPSFLSLSLSLSFGCF